VKGDGKTVRLVAHPLQQAQSRAVAANETGIGLARHKDLIQPFGERCDRLGVNAQGRECLQRRIELALAPVNENQIGERLPFPLQAAVAAAHRLAHHREIIGCGFGADAEVPVVAAVRLAVDKTDHRSDRVSALNVGDIKSFDAQRRFFQEQILLQGLD